MIAIHDSEQFDEDDEEEEEVKPVRHSTAAVDLETKYAKICKELSFKLHESIQKTANEIENGEGCEISSKIIHEWLHDLKKLNCSLSQYAHASVARVDRLQVEIALANNSMASDLLDREACHTATLEAIHNSHAGDSVERAMHFVSQMRCNSAPFTAEGTQGYFGAARCVLSAEHKVQ